MPAKFISLKRCFKQIAVTVFEFVQKFQLNYFLADNPQVKMFARRGPPIRFPGNANRNRDCRHCLAHNTKNMRPGTRKKENPENYQETGRNPSDGAKVRIDNKISRLTIFRNVGSGRIEFLFQSRGPGAVRRGAASSAPRLFLLKNYSIIKF